MALDGLIGRALIAAGIGIMLWHSPDVWYGARLGLQGTEAEAVVVNKRVDRIGGGARQTFSPNLIGKRYDRFIDLTYVGPGGQIRATAPVFREAYRGIEVGQRIPVRILPGHPDRIDAQPWGVFLEGLYDLWIGGLFIVVGGVLAFVVARK